MASLSASDRYWVPPPRDMLADHLARQRWRWPGVVARGLRDPRNVAR